MRQLNEKMKALANENAAIKGVSRCEKFHTGHLSLLLPGFSGWGWPALQPSTPVAGQPAAATAAIALPAPAAHHRRHVGKTFHVQLHCLQGRRHGHGQQRRAGPRDVPKPAQRARRARHGEPPALLAALP